MHRDRHVGLGKARQQSVSKHCFGAANGFLRRLSDQHQGSVPGIFAVRHDRRRPQNRRHVHIVSAGVHDRNIVSCIIFGADLARIGQPGLLFHRQRIQFGAQHHRRPCAILQDGNNARSTHVFGNLVAKSSQPSRQLRRGLHFVRREFRVLMNIKVKRVRLGIDSVDFFG